MMFQQITMLSLFTHPVFVIQLLRPQLGEEADSRRHVPLSCCVPKILCSSHASPPVTSGCACSCSCLALAVLLPCSLRCSPGDLASRLALHWRLGECVCDSPASRSQAKRSVLTVLVCSAWLVVCLLHFFALPSSCSFFAPLVVDFICCLHQKQL